MRWRALLTAVLGVIVVVCAVWALGSSGDISVGVRAVVVGSVTAAAGLLVKQARTTQDTEVAAVDVEGAGTSSTHVGTLILGVVLLVLATLLSQAEAAIGVLVYLVCAAALPYGRSVIIHRLRRSVTDLPVRSDSR